jgi:Universal stress protein family
MLQPYGASRLSPRLSGFARRWATPSVFQGGKPVDIEGLRGIKDLQCDDRRPVDALVAASAGTDLLVLGSRGLHGLDALGSVSERVAHTAKSSVLVVSPFAYPRDS